MKITFEEYVSLIGSSLDVSYYWPNRSFSCKVDGMEILNESLVSYPAGFGSSPYETIDDLAKSVGGKTVRLPTGSYEERTWRNFNVPDSFEPTPLD